MRKIIVSVAPTGGTNISEKVLNPLSPEEIAQDVISATEAGASMVHLHVRDREGKLTGDLTEFSHTLDLIREGSDIIIQGSTGGVSTLSLEERSVALNDPRVEVASLNMGSANFEEGVYINTLPDIRYWASRMKEKRVQPGLEIFEGGMVNNVLILTAEGYLSPPFTFAFCLGFRGALPATAVSLQFLERMLPPESIWGLIHHGMTDLSLLATAIGMCATFVRVGFEDSIYYAPGCAARTNTELVEKIVRLIRNTGLDIATPLESRKILGLH